MQLKTITITIFLFLVLIVPSNPLSAQGNIWSLERCVLYALDNNIQVKQQALNSGYLENAYTQSKYERFPNLNASASHNYQFGRALDQSTYRFTEDETVQSNSFSASGGITLFNGFRINNTIKQNEYNLLASQKDLDKIRNDISLFVAINYLQILFNKELAEVARAQLELTREQVSRTQKLVNAGSLPKGNLFEIQAQEATEELQLVNAENQLEISYLDMIQLLELDSVGDFEIVIPEIEISDEELIPYSAGEIFNQAESIMPQIKSAEFQLKSSETGFIIAKGLRSPTLSFNTYWGTRYSDLITRFLLDGSGNPIIGGDGFPLTESTPFLDQLSDNIGYGIGLNLSIPIFNRWQTNYMISNAKLGLDNSRLVLENEKNLLYKDIQQSYADARAALKRYRASQKTVISTEESFRYTEQRFNVGLVTSVEYNTSKNLLTQAQSDRLQAKYDYIFQKNKLEFYLGNPIKI